MAPGVITTPSLGHSLVVRRGILTVPSEDALVSCACVTGGRSCNGLQPNQLPLNAWVLEKYVREMGTRFIERMRVRGFEWVGSELLLHGPWSSYEFNRTMVDVESSLWAEAKRLDDPSLILPLVIEQPKLGGYMDYLLVGRFLKQYVLTEVLG